MSSNSLSSAFTLDALHAELAPLAAELHLLPQRSDVQPLQLLSRSAPDPDFTNNIHSFFFLILGDHIKALAYYSIKSIHFLHVLFPYRYNLCVYCMYYDVCIVCVCIYDLCMCVHGHVCVMVCMYGGQGIDSDASLCPLPCLWQSLPCTRLFGLGASWKYPVSMSWL